MRLQALKERSRVVLLILAKACCRADLQKLLRCMLARQAWNTCRQASLTHGLVPTTELPSNCMQSPLGYIHWAM